MGNGFESTDISVHPSPYSEEIPYMGRYVPVQRIAVYDGDKKDELQWPELEELCTDTIQRITRDDIRKMIQEQCKIRKLDSRNKDDRITILLNYLNHLFYNDPTVTAHVKSLVGQKTPRRDMAIVLGLALSVLTSAGVQMRVSQILQETPSMMSEERANLELILKVCVTIIITAFATGIVFGLQDQRNATIRKLEDFIQKTVMIKKSP